MNKTVLGIRIIFYFVFFALPFLGMLNCEGWNEGSMKVSSCYVDSEFLRFFAELFYGLLLLSAFTLFVPFFVYAGVVIAVTELVVKLLKKEDKDKPIEFKKPNSSENNKISPFVIIPFAAIGFIIVLAIMSF